MSDDLQPPEPPNEQNAPFFKLGGPVICEQTESAKVCPFDEFTLSVVAGDCASGITFQWYIGKSGDTSSLIAGEISASVKTTIVAATDFWVRVTNTHSSFVDSETFEMDVFQVPNITQQPLSIFVPVCETATVEFSVLVESCIVTDVLTYQWYVGLSGDASSPIAGETNPTLSVTAGINANYWVRITSTSTGFITDSDTAMITLILVPQITQQPDLIIQVSTGQSATVSVQVTSSSLTFQWYEGPSGDISVPITGATSFSLTLTDIQTSIDVWVRVSNPCGSVDSDVSQVLVTDPPEMASLITEFGVVGSPDPLVDSFILEFGLKPGNDPRMTDAIIEYGFEE